MQSPPAPQPPPQQPPSQQPPPPVVEISPTASKTAEQLEVILKEKEQEVSRLAGENALLVAEIAVSFRPRGCSYLIPTRLYENDVRETMLNWPKRARHA